MVNRISKQVHMIYFFFCVLAVTSAFIGGGVFSVISQPYLDVIGLVGFICMVIYGSMGIGRLER